MFKNKCEKNISRFGWNSIWVEWVIESSKKLITVTILIILRVLRNQKSKTSESLLFHHNLKSFVWLEFDQNLFIVHSKLASFLSMCCSNIGHFKILQFFTHKASDRIKSNDVFPLKAFRSFSQLQTEKFSHAKSFLEFGFSLIEQTGAKTEHTKLISMLPAHSAWRKWPRNE